MDDLFEQLKKAPAVNKNTKAPPTRNFKSPTLLEDFESNALGRSTSRRESMPSPSSSMLFKKLNSHKSRSLSPPKHYIKPFKVLIERKKLEDVMKTNKEKQKKTSKSASKTMADAYRELFKLPSNVGKTVKSPPKTDKSAKERKSDKVEKLVKSPSKAEKPIKTDKSMKSPPQLEKVDKLLKSPNSKGKPIKAHNKTPPKAEKSGKADKGDKIVEKTTPSKKSFLSNSSSSSSSIGSSNSSPKKVTPTKAQQKQFAPCDTIPSYATLNMQQLFKKKKQLHKIKRCVVRLPRQNLKKLQKKFFKLNSKNGKITGRQAIKRKSSDKNSPSPTKRSKESNKKETTGFFIKLSSPSVLKAQTKKHLAKKTELKNRLSLNQKSSKFGSSYNHYKSSSSTTKPTKFTRTQLIKAFGKRFFKSHVKIEKCNHPMMLIFESNARARKLQAKRNKSKNLSVSFKEQVEIFGCTDSEDYDSSDADSDVEYRPRGSSARKVSSFNAVANRSANLSTSLTSLPATPARLKKVENGKVVDDIELDPALFLDPSVVAIGVRGSSTPYGHSPGRKKREKKSFSPLKSDATSSPRKEQFKLANEKMPPSGLRRLNIDDVDDEDDEDDDCEYIVPIDIPQRRTSRTNSNNGAESSSSFQSTLDVPSTIRAGSLAALNKSNETEADAPTPDDLRLDAPTPDDLELDAPTPEGIDTMIGAEDDISSRIPETEKEKVNVEKIADKKADANNDDLPILTPIVNEYTPTPPTLANESPVSMPALELSEEANDQDNSEAQSLDGNEESNIDTNKQDEDVDVQRKQLKENAVIATTTNGNGENGSVAADGSNAANEQDISLTMFVEDTQGEEDLIENILKERIDEIVKDVDMNDSSKESIK